MTDTGKSRKPQGAKGAPSHNNYHTNAEDVLPDDLLKSVQVYFRGGRLYIPSPGWNLARDDAICTMWKERRDTGMLAKDVDSEVAEKFGIGTRRVQQITSEGGLRSSAKSKRNSK